MIAKQNIIKAQWTSNIHWRSKDTNHKIVLNCTGASMFMQHGVCWLRLSGHSHACQFIAWFHCLGDDQPSTIQLCCCMYRFAIPGWPWSQIFPIGGLVYCMVTKHLPMITSLLRSSALDGHTPGRPNEWTMTKSKDIWTNFKKSGPKMKTNDICCARTHTNKKRPCHATATTDAVSWEKKQQWCNCNTGRGICEKYPIQNLMQWSYLIFLWISNKFTINPIFTLWFLRGRSKNR